MESTHTAGVQPAIKLQQTAIAKALLMQAENPKWRDLSLRLYISGKGCSGFEYGVSFDTPTPSDKHFRYIFQKKRLDVIVDTDTLEFIKDSSVEWVDDERGQGFLVTNPREKHFRGKFFKKSFWKKKLTHS